MTPSRRLAESWRRWRARRRTPRADERAAIMRIVHRRADVPEPTGPVLALDEPGQWADTLAALGGAPVRAVVCSSLARVFPVPWQAPLAREATWQAFAIERLRHLYGDDGAAWRVTLDGAWPPRPRLAVALPRAIVDALSDAAGGRLQSVRVRVVDDLRALLKTRPGLTGVAVALDPRGAWIAAYRNGALERSRRCRLDRTLPLDESLAPLLAMSRAEASLIAARSDVHEGCQVVVLGAGERAVGGTADRAHFERDAATRLSAMLEAQPAPGASA